MSAKNLTLPDGLHDVLLKAFNVLKGSGSTSFLALASAIALRRTGLTTQQVHDARQCGFRNFLSDVEVALAVSILNNRFNSLSNEKFRQILDVLDLPEQTSFSDKEWGAAFDLCLDKFKPVLGKSAMLVQPKELTQLVASIYSIEEGATVYSPFSGGCCVVPYLPRGVNFIAQELQDEEWAIGKLRLAAYGLNSTAQLSQRDPVLECDSNINNYVFSFPPFEYNNASYENQYFTGGLADAALLEKCLPSLEKEAKVVMVVPYWFLSAEGNFGLRKHLVENDLLESVVSLPRSIYAGITYPVALLCLNKLKKNKNKIVFFHAEDLISQSVSQKPVVDVETVLNVLQGKSETDKARFVSAGMVQKRGYHLHPRWHLLDIEHGLKETDHLVRLGSIATFIQGKYRTDATTVADRILLKDLCDDALDFELSQQASGLAASRGEAATIVDESCLLVALGLNKLRPSWYSPTGKRPICFGDEICALKIDTSKVDIAYLISELHSPFVKYQFNMLKGGMSRMRESDLLSIELRLPALEELSVKAE